MRARILFGHLSVSNGQTQSDEKSQINVMAKVIRAVGTNGDSGHRSSLLGHQGCLLINLIYFKYREASPERSSIFKGRAGIRPEHRRV